MKELFKDTWAENDNGVRIFLLAGKEKALVIDTGISGPDIHSLVTAKTDLPYQLLTTHADGDHISGHDQFAEFYMHPSEAFFYHDHSKHGKILPVFDGDVINLGDRAIEVIHIPGHTPGSITVLDRENR
ncbi:MAG: MBL fold metallo-hydrolase, partial [Oscillospiraceae bacterium]|nr:MBL fold metallo-hydrolase [Oscillospiraceae bacterium]